MKKTLSAVVGIATVCGCTTAPVNTTSQTTSENHKTHAQQGLQYIQSGLVNEAISSSMKPSSSAKLNTLPLVQKYIPPEQPQKA